MRLIKFFEETDLIADLINNRVDDRSPRDKEEDEEDNRVYPNPLPVMSPNDPRWIDWHERGDALGPENAQRVVVPINRLISTERFLEPDALKRSSDSKFSSAVPGVYKIDGNLLIVDGNHRVVQTHLNGRSKIEVDLYDVDEYERRGA